MAVKLLCLCLLLVLLCPSQAKKEQCLTSASNCDECIQSGPECAWCTEPHSNIRCHTSKGLRTAGCLKAHIYNPQGGMQVVRNGSRYEFWSKDPLYTRNVHQIKDICSRTQWLIRYWSSWRLLNFCSTEPVNARSVFLQPQELSLRLRPGVRQSFPLTIAMPTDQPITELTMDTSDLPVGVNITFSNIMKGNPLVVEVSKIKMYALCRTLGNRSY